MRLPTFVIERTDAATIVHLIDLRYARRPNSGFGTARVELSRTSTYASSAHTAHTP